MPKDIRYVTKADLVSSGPHKPWLRPLGRVLASDVGKKCVLSDGVWQVENDHQFKNRLAAEAGLRPKSKVFTILGYLGQHDEGGAVISDGEIRVVTPSVSELGNWGRYNEVNKFVLDALVAAQAKGRP